MLLGTDASVRPFPWRDPDEPTEAECGRLRSRLSGAVERWPWSTELGLRLSQLSPAGHSLSSGSAHEFVCYALAPGLTLMLSRRVAVAIVCLSMGGTMPATEDSHLSALDLDVLDIWVRSALASAAGTAGISAEGTAYRLESCAAPRERVLAAHLAWAGERPAGILMVPTSSARRAHLPHGPALGDRPEMLADATISLTAWIDGPMLSLAELLRLEVGDVVLFGCKSALEVKLNAADATLAIGRPVAQKGRTALRIDQVCGVLRAPNSPGEIGRELSDD